MTLFRRPKKTITRQVRTDNSGCWWTESTRAMSSGRGGAFERKCINNMSSVFCWWFRPPTLTRTKKVQSDFGFRIFNSIFAKTRGVHRFPHGLYFTDIESGESVQSQGLCAATRRTACNRRPPWPEVFRDWRTDCNQREEDWGVVWIQEVCCFRVCDGEKGCPCSEHQRDFASNSIWVKMQNLFSFIPQFWPPFGHLFEKGNENGVCFSAHPICVLEHF